MIKNFIRSHLQERCGKLPLDFKITLLDAPESTTEIEFVGTFKGIEICSGRCSVEDPSFCYYTFINKQEPIWKVFRLIGKLACVKEFCEWNPPPYPSVPKIFDGNSIKGFFHGVIETMFKVPVQSRLLLIDKNFRFQPGDNLAKICAPRYRIEVSFLGDVLFSIDLARGVHATFIQNQKDSDTNFIPVDARVLVQMKKEIRSDIHLKGHASGKKILKTVRLDEHDFFYYFDKAQKS